MKKILSAAVVAALLATTSICAFAEDTAEVPVDELYTTTDVVVEDGADDISATPSDEVVYDTADGAVETDAETTADKGSPDTGVEGVAAVAGIAILAAGALLVTSKSKK